MKILVVTNDEMKAELLQQGIKETVSVEWFSDINEIGDTIADVCIDLLFSKNSEERIILLKQLPMQFVIVNDVIGKSGNLPDSFVRINGWPTFLKSPVIEAATRNEASKIYTTEFFNCFNKKMEWVEDAPGFITSRIISMIINEAYFTLNENISTKEEIDIAMKLGTNYPYGPFEWCDLIGIKNIYNLLEELSKHNERYRPSDLLKIEATS